MVLTLPITKSDKPRIEAMVTEVKDNCKMAEEHFKEDIEPPQRKAAIYKAEMKAEIGCHSPLPKPEDDINGGETKGLKDEVADLKEELMKLKEELKEAKVSKGALEKMQNEVKQLQEEVRNLTGK